MARVAPKAHSHRWSSRMVAPAFASLLLTIVGCGGDDAATAPTTSPVSTSVAPATSTSSTTVPAVTTAPSTTAAAPLDGPSVTEGQTLNRVWFVHAERLSPAYREGTTAGAALRDLLAGPSAQEADRLASMIPTGTRFRSISVAEGVATVDLTGSFGSGGGSLSMVGRLAQLVYTVTEFPGVDAVSLALEGASVDFLGGEGIDVSKPLGRADFDDFKPFIVVTNPLPGQVVSSPFLVSGENSTDENNVQIGLAASSGRQILSTFTTGAGPIRDTEGNPLWGPYQASIAVPEGESGDGILTVFASSLDTGLPLVEFPVPLRVSTAASPGLPGASVEPVSTPDTPGGPGITAQLVEVRTGRHDGYERVVFEFSTEFVPGYVVQYVEGPIHADPSDLLVAVSGDSYLIVRMSAASGVDLTSDTFRLSYTGPDRLSLGYPAVQEVVEFGDFEGVLNWVIGVRTKPAFKVTTLSNPTRVVVDIASAGVVAGTS